MAGYLDLTGAPDDVVSILASSVPAPGSPFAKPGPYLTTLGPSDEAKFQAWVKQNNIPNENDTSTSDYDMRGYWKDNQGHLNETEMKKDGLHFPDTYKTPWHHTFSNESRYALPSAPHWNDQDQLIQGNGVVLSDEGNLKLPQSSDMRSPVPQGTQTTPQAPSPLMGLAMARNGQSSDPQLGNMIMPALSAGALTGSGWGGALAGGVLTALFQYLHGKYGSKDSKPSGILG